MNDKIIKSFIGLILLLSVVFLFGEPARAETVKQFNDKEIFVSFSDLPFNLNNFYPGKETEIKTITIKNKEDFDIDVSIGANSVFPDLKLAQVLVLQIAGNNISVFDLLQDNVEIGSIKANEEEDYDLRIKFDKDAGNQYQSLNIEFDLVITVTETGEENGNGENEEGDEEDEEKILIATTPSSGEGGSFIQPLKVSKEQVILDRQDPETVIITWLSNQKATSRVLYDTKSRSLSTTPPNYSYTYYTEEKKDKITFHEVELTNLDPNTTYYYRVVSRISSATIGNEFQFTTYNFNEDEENGDQEVKGEKEEAEKEEGEKEGQEVKGDKVTGEAEEQEENSDFNDPVVEREGFSGSPNAPDASQEVAGIKVGQEDEEEEQEDLEAETLQPEQKDFQEKTTSTSEKSYIIRIFNDWWPLALLVLALGFWLFFIYKRREDEE